MMMLKVVGATILGIGVVALGLLLTFEVWAPLLPEKAQQRVAETIPDFFGGSRAGIGTGGAALPPGSQEVPQPIAWRVQTYDGAYVDVLPFASTTSTGQPGASSSPSSSATSSALPAQDVTVASGGVRDGQEDLPAYLVRYIAHDQSFTISLFSEPLRDVRRAAEIDLLARLGISESQACRLKYAVLTPQWVNSFHAGKNLGFSFCPGSPQF